MILLAFFLILLLYGHLRALPLQMAARLWLGQTVALAPFIPNASPRAGWTHRRIRSPSKPRWVISELLLIKAWTPKLGCRRIAEIFNRRHDEDGVSVSKSTVARILIAHNEELARLRRKLHRRRTQLHTAPNDEWAMDLTSVRGNARAPRLLLGLIDYGSRVCIALHELTDKHSKTIWFELLHLFKNYGMPKRIRVDNEPSFNSRWLKWALWMLGVRLITNKPHSPWQNGRIERLFRTFKEDFKKVAAGNLALRLKEWRWIYNYARPHMGIGYRTPAEVWLGRPKSIGVPRRISLWNGALRAYFFPD